MSEYLVLRDVLILSSMLISDSCLSDPQMLKLVHNIHTHDIHLILINIEKLDRFHKDTLRQFQSLPKRAAIPSVYLLLGALPIEAELHISYS
jgi:hypothetical protein